jgi:hypothetical protein
MQSESTLLADAPDANDALFRTFTGDTHDSLVEYQLGRLPDFRLEPVFEPRSGEIVEPGGANPRVSHRGETSKP